MKKSKTCDFYLELQDSSIDIKPTESCSYFPNKYPYQRYFLKLLIKKFQKQRSRFLLKSFLNGTVS